MTPERLDQLKAELKEIIHMKKVFISAQSQKADGWMLAQFGNSAIDGKDYTLDTDNLRGDELPPAMEDPKTATRLVAGLLNAYYNGVSVVGLSEEKVMKMGIKG